MHLSITMINKVTAKELDGLKLKLLKCKETPYC